MRYLFTVILYIFYSSLSSSQTVALTPGTIGSAQTICYNTSPVKLSQLTAPGGGSGTYTYQWQKSTNNSTWTNISGATLSGYSPSALKVNTWFRRRVTSGTSGSAFTNTVLITVYTNLTGGTIGPAQTICYNSLPSSLSQITAPTGATGTYAFQWQSSPNKTTWTNISGATDINYSPGTLITNTYFRRRVTSGTCGTASSNSILITVLPKFTSAQLHDNISINNNTSTNINIVITGGTSPYAINYSRNGTSQSVISNYTSGTNFSTGILTTGIYTYDLSFVTDARGCTAQSLGTNITVSVIDDGSLTAGSIGTPQTICANTAPDPLTQITAPTGGTGIYIFQWQSSPDNSTWTNISGATLAGYSPPALTASTYFRRTATSGTYSPVNSSQVLITVSPAITLAQLHDNITITDNTSTNINTVITGGTSPFTINYSLNGVAQTTINNYSSGANIYTGVLTAGIYTYSLISVTDARGCIAQSLGNNITVTVDYGSLSAGSIGMPQTICANTAPDPLTQITAPTGGTGIYTFQWQSSPDNSTWTNISGATLAGYSPPALSANTYFRRTVTSGSYNPVNSAEVLITLSPAITLAQLHDSITITNYSSTNINTVLTGGTSPFAINYSRNGVAQQAINSYSSGTNIPTGELTEGVYIYSLTSVSDARGCIAQNLGTSITVTVTHDLSLSAGSIGTAQTICANTAPAPLNQLTDPEGGTGTYTFQWQSSPDNSTWTNISGATLPGYSPPALTASTYFRRTVTSGTYSPVNTSQVLITVSPAITLAQLHDNITITDNTSTNINTVITGGTSPFTINYSLNGVAQTTINNYSSGANIATGVLTAGVYTYSLISVTDARGCIAQSLGNNITVTVDYGSLSAGSIGIPQTICANTAPAPFTQLTPPTGGTGTYTFQWQSSPNNSTWTNISGATLPGYSPPALTASTYFRRTVTSGTYSPVNTSQVLITVSPAITLAQLHDNITITDNTSTNINTVITGGTSPFTINYSLNGVAQTTINNYSSGANIATGVLTAGVYTYSLISVTDARGCTAQNLGTNISITVTEYIPPVIATVDSLFRAETPNDSDYDSRYELGTEFTVLSAGVLTKARLFTHISEGGDHIIRLWVLNGSAYTLLAGPYTWNFSSGIHGWRSYKFPTPITVAANKTYILSITNGTDKYYEKQISFQWSNASTYLRYLRGTYSTVLGQVPKSTYSASCYFRDVVFSIPNVNGNLTAGSVGTPQTICANSVPAPLTQLTAPTGGTGTYTFQWQSSPNNSKWTNISGATLSGYSPPALTASTYFRRTVTSGTYSPVNSSQVLITVSPAITLAQLHDDISIASNSSVNFNVVIAGGTSPFSINYYRNEVAQQTVNGYFSGGGISTGILSTGVYTYALASVTDAAGCSAQSLGTDIKVNATDSLTGITKSNKALVIVNSGSAYYSDYVTYIAPYLDNFGIPYDLCNISTTALPELNDYAVMIFGHDHVYQSGYPISSIETAVNNGVGLYSFDSHLFDYASAFNTLVSARSVNSDQINISDYSHFITKYHNPDIYSPTNDKVPLLNNMSMHQNSSLLNGTILANIGTGGETVSLLEVSNYGMGKIVKWSGYEWVTENILGPVYGMDDLIWRGIVWAARKPFVMQGLPPMFTMRVDDASGDGYGVTGNWEWVNICNDYGIIPWCGLFLNYMNQTNVDILKSKLDRNLATSAPHAYGGSTFMYFNHDNITSPAFDAAANTRNGRDFFIQNGLKISNYLVPHYYEISSEALPEVRAMGVEFLGIHMLPDNLYYTSPWLNCAPYRINRNGIDYYARPVYYGGYVNLSGISFFNCITEIRDDGGYEWYPDNNIDSTAARGIRHMRRALNSMVLPVLFTHEYYFDVISPANFREIIVRITSAVSEYNPEYTSTDYAMKYIRAKSNIRITGVHENQSDIQITYDGSNDMETKCYLFTEPGGQITSRFILLPQINGNSTISISK